MEKQMIKKDKHVIEYDLMRVIFMLMTLGVHVVAYKLERNCLWMILDNFFIVCNPLFIMLSGRLNLDKEFKNKKDYMNYYKRKFVSIIIPFLVFSIIIQLVQYKSFNGFLKNLISNNIEPTYWFVYTLIGILILSPFYSKMLQNMNKNEKKYFLYISIIANFIILLFDFFNISTTIGIGSVGIIGWHFYYFSGYIIEEVFEEKDKKTVYILSILLFILACTINMNIKYYYKFKEPGIVLTFLAFAIYLLIKDSGKIKNKMMANIISFISKYSYAFYLAHMITLNYILNYFNLYSISIDIIAIFIITLIITLCISIIVQEIIINPIQKKISKYLKL